jgi:hypothetical protein
LLNEQFTSMTPFSHIDQPGLSWRTRDRRGYFFHEAPDSFFIAGPSPAMKK